MRPVFKRKRFAPGTESKPTENTIGAPKRGKLKRALLLYRPSRRKAWLYRIPFYFFAFFMVPFLSFLGLGAYVGPDKSLVGIPLVAMIVLLCVWIRKGAIRADTTFGKPKASEDDGRQPTEKWPFPLQEPPPRRPLLGYVVSATGMALMAVGFYFGGLAAVGVVFPILLLSGVEMGPILRFLDDELGLQFSDVVLASAILGIVAAFACVLAFSIGQRLRDHGRRLRARDARTLLHHRGESHVLLLRSFEDEELQDPRPLSLFQLRYEDQLNSALDHLGPVITVGRPGDDLGYSGAARIYVLQTNWQEAIQYLMTHSMAVVIIVGETEGLWWEIETALECVPRKRLLFFFPFVRKSEGGLSHFTDFKEFLISWNLPFTRRRYKQMEAERLDRYRLFRKRTASFFGDELPQSMKNALFLDFLPDGEARLLHSRFGFRWNLWDLIPRFRRIRFNMTRTLWPFLDKLNKSTN